MCVDHFLGGIFAFNVPAVNVLCSQFDFMEYYLCFQLTIKVKSKMLMSTNTLAQFDLLLSDFPLELKPLWVDHDLREKRYLQLIDFWPVMILFTIFRVETVLEEKIAKRQGGGSLKLDLSLEYTELPNIQNNIEAVSNGKPQSEITCGEHVFTYSSSLMGFFPSLGLWLLSNVEWIAFGRKLGSVTEQKHLAGLMHCQFFFWRT